MGIIDRLRAQPRWKHADAQVRFEAVRELADDQQEAFAALARDAEARVRRAAVTRLEAPSVLGDVLAHDVDESVRVEARSRLLSLAVGSDDPDAAAASVSALREAGDLRPLATAAKTARLESAAMAALEAVQDPRALSAVARQAVHETVARAAVQRLHDPGELAQVALKSEHRDVALAALEHVTDPESLQAIGARAKHKTVARRAKAILHVPDEPEQPVGSPGPQVPEDRPDEAAETPVAPLHDDVRRSLAEVCAQLETLVHDDAGASLAAGLDAASARWAGLLAPPADPADADIESRYEAAVQAVRDRLAHHARVEEEQAASRAREEAEQAAERVHAARLEAEVAAQDAGERLARLDQVLGGAEQLLDAHDLPDARARWTALRREWTALVAGLVLDEATAARVRQIEERLEAREAELREARAQQQRDNLARLQHVCEQLEQLAQGEHVALRDAERGLREARAALDAPGPLPTRQDQQQIVARLKAVQASLFPRVQDLREADEWERWANAGVQESLIRRLEALREEPDLGAVAKQLRGVQDEWHKVRAVPREKGRELWQRYKTIEGEIRARCEVFFQHQAVERGENLKAKEALCAQVEALAESTDWIRTAETIKGLQAQWKTVGPVTPGHEKAIWERFRQACDHFFTRRKEDLSQRKATWSVNLQKKEAICAEIEALGETTDWDKGLADVKRLQADWRAVGPVKRTRADAILLRFRTSCEHFFERYAHRNEVEFAEHAAARERICQELEALLPAPDQEAATEPAAVEGLSKKVQAFKRQWDQAPSLPRAQAEPLGDRFGAALARLASLYPEGFRGTDLDPDANRRKLEGLCEQVEGYLAADDPAMANASPAEILAMQWREALAANTIGGRVDDEAKWRTAAEEIRKAQAAWKRVGPVPDPAGRELNDRFQRACNRFFKQRDQRRRPSSAPVR